MWHVTVAITTTECLENVLITKKLLAGCLVLFCSRCVFHACIQCVKLVCQHHLMQIMQNQAPPLTGKRGTGNSLLGEAFRHKQPKVKVKAKCYTCSGFFWQNLWYILFKECFNILFCICFLRTITEQFDLSGVTFSKHGGWIFLTSRYETSSATVNDGILYLKNIYLNYF